MTGNDTILGNFKIKIAIDTQILAYLVDESYPNLNVFFRHLADCPFVDIVCSRFVSYEFIGVRKLEHYLRAIYNQTKNGGGQMGFSSVLKYKNGWNAPELKYDIVYKDVKEKVENDLKRVNDDFGVQYNESLHTDLWHSHQELVLSSKISKEDSLVLLSSVFPEIGVKEEHLIFLTNDDQFYRAFCGDSKMDSVEDVFKELAVAKPDTFKIDKITTPISKKDINLIGNKAMQADITDFIKLFIFEFIQIKNKKYYLGNLVACPKKMLGRLLCFKLQSNSLVDGLYISILDKDLRFLYNHPLKLKDFYNKQKIEAYPYFATEDEASKNISVEITNVDGEQLNSDFYNQITQSGNLIYIHPDYIF